MKQSTCGAVFCQPSGNELKNNIGTQCGTTASDRTVQVPVIVNQTQNLVNPTQQLVVGSRPSRPSKYTKTLIGKVSKYTLSAFLVHNALEVSRSLSKTSFVQGVNRLPRALFLPH